MLNERLALGMYPPPPMSPLPLWRGARLASKVPQVPPPPTTTRKRLDCPRTTVPSHSCLFSRGICPPSCRNKDVAIAQNIQSLCVGSQKVRKGWGIRVHTWKYQLAHTLSLYGARPPPPRHTAAVGVQHYTEMPTESASNEGTALRSVTSQQLKGKVARQLIDPFLCPCFYSWDKDSVHKEIRVRGHGSYTYKVLAPLWRSRTAPGAGTTSYCIPSVHQHQHGLLQRELGLPLVGSGEEPPRGVGCRPVPEPKGRGDAPPPPLRTSKMVVWVNGFCGCRRRRRFCFRHTAGVIFFSLPYVSILKIVRIQIFRYSEFCGDFKNG